jgi:hypothetical protein
MDCDHPRNLWPLRYADDSEPDVEDMMQTAYFLVIPRNDGDECPCFDNYVKCNIWRSAVDGDRKRVLNYFVREMNKEGQYDVGSDTLVLVNNAILYAIESIWSLRDAHEIRTHVTGLWCILHLNNAIFVSHLIKCNFGHVFASLR